MDEFHRKGLRGRVLLMKSTVDAVYGEELFTKLIREALMCYAT